jgi:uncharacterized protein GlcG (DUF336 family)
MTVRRWALDESDARAASELAVETARERGVSVVVVVVDAAGELMHLVRMDGTKTTSIRIAIGKAWTAAMFQLPTEDYAERILPGGASFGIQNVFPGDMLALPGGIPIVIDGDCVGAIGLSGAPPEVDAEIAAATAAAVAERARAGQALAGEG